MSCIIPCESWLMFPQGTFTGKAHASNCTQHVWGWDRCKLCTQGPKPWLAGLLSPCYLSMGTLRALPGLGVYDTSIKDEHINLFCGKCTWPFTFARWEYVLFQHRGELDHTQTIQWHLGWDEWQSTEGVFSVGQLSKCITNVPAEFVIG